MDPVLFIDASGGETAVQAWSARDLFTALRSPNPKNNPMVDNVERLDHSEHIDFVEEGGSRKPTAKPLAVAGFCDGIQAGLRLRHVEHRPVYLTYVAAGAALPPRKPVAVVEDLHILASWVDVDWLESLDLPVPVRSLRAAAPPEVERVAAQRVATLRTKLEKTLTTALLQEGKVPLAVDGSLSGRTQGPLLGVVKSTKAKYLPDESILWGLRGGFRTPIFRIPAGTAGHGIDRFSCYVRLFDGDGGWNWGLVRLEAFDVDLLDAGAALAMSQRQSPTSGDLRWDRHLAGMRAAEDWLRARRSPVFDLFK